jgi:hypothetical protein
MAFCKKRALEYLNEGDLANAMTSMLSDLEKHPETQNHAGKHLFMLAVLYVQNKDREGMRRWIEGFN